MRFSTDVKNTLTFAISEASEDYFERPRVSDYMQDGIGPIWHRTRANQIRPHYPDTIYVEEDCEVENDRFLMDISSSVTGNR